VTAPSAGRISSSRSRHVAAWLPEPSRPPWLRPSTRATPLPSARCSYRPHNPSPSHRVSPGVGQAATTSGGYPVVHITGSSTVSYPFGIDVLPQFPVAERRVPQSMKSELTRCRDEIEGRRGGLSPSVR
jgi:hypothetical protein